MKKFFSFSFFKHLLEPDSSVSIKSFSMMSSVILGFILGLMLGTSILIDAWDGKIDSDMYGCAAYLVGIGALVSLSSLPKTIVDNKKASKETTGDTTKSENEDSED